MPLWAQAKPLLYSNNLFDLPNFCIIPLGGRLKNFRILIGEEFSYGETQINEIGSWKECASVTGK